WPSLSGRVSKARAMTGFGNKVASNSNNSGVAAIDSVTATDNSSAVDCSMTPADNPELNSTKANSPPCEMASAKRRAAPGPEPRAPTKPEQEEAFDHQQANHQGGDAPRVLRNQAGIERHADGGEKQTEQQTLERRDVGLDLMAIV